MIDTRASLSAEDRFAIADLLSTLCDAIDRRDPDCFAACLAEDARFSLGPDTVTGRDAIVAALTERSRDAPGVGRHLWSNLLLSVGDDRHVTARSVMTVLLSAAAVGGATNVYRVADVTDQLVRSDTSWLLAAREIATAIDV